MKSVFLRLGILVFSFARAAASDSVVVFNEVSYHPATDESANEWVELHNQMSIDIDLSGWHIEDGVNFTFVEGTIIPGHGYLVVASNPSALQAAAGITGVYGPFTGSLNNAGEKLELRDRNERLMDRMEYGDGSKWPLAADGSGATLSKRDQDTPSGEPDRWTSSVVTSGTPGRRNFPDTVSVTRSLIPMNSLWRFEASGTDLGTGWRAAAFDDSGWAGQNAAALLSYWTFDGNATATRGTNGTFSGAVTAAPDRNNVAGGALAFSGASQYVNVTGGGGLNGAASGTISMWAKWNGTSQDADCCGSWGAILARQGNGLFSDDIIALNAANPATARIVWRQSGGPAPVLITGTTAVGNTWHHVAVTFSPAGSTLYVDGVAQGNASGAGMSNNPGVPLSVGAWAGDGGGFMNGSLDDVAIWDQPLSAAQIAALAASTKTPLSFGGPENAVYYSGDGRITTNDELRKTQLQTTPVTSYFRRAFTFSDDIARTQLKLDLALDDGAVFYLNGTEIYRHNMPGGTVNFSTLASTPIADAPFLTAINIPSTGLVQGNNVLAVEVHQAVASDPGMVFGAGLSGVVTPAGTEALIPDNLVFNEVSAAGVPPFRLELINRGAGALDTGGYVIKRTGISPDAEFTLPAQMLTAGGFLSLNESTLGFSAVSGDKLFLYRPERGAVADSLEVHDRARARFPDGTGEFLTPSALTFGAANAVALNTAVVINEIMYHAPPTLDAPASGGNPATVYAPSPEEWLELHNRSAQPVNLTGWRLDGGIDYPFPAGTTMAAGAHLVIAKDPVALQTKFPAIVPIGPYNNKLSHSGELVVLRDAADNPADSVHYYDDGRWPEAADAGGASLELRDPRSDNNIGESWAASNETGRTAWKTYTYRGIATASQVGPDAQWNEFVLGLLDKGEVLLDDISVIENPATAPFQVIQNGSFTTDAGKWRIIGNHHGTVIDDPSQPGNKVLRLVATGSTEHMSNHAETTLVTGHPITNGREYEISFRARWVSGCRQLNTRLYFNRLPRIVVLDAPALHGTPGLPNSTFTPNTGPSYSGFRHDPVVPAAFIPVVVSVDAADPDNVSSMTLWSKPDGGAWASQPMSASASAPQHFTATLTGRAASTIVQFYVEGVDGQGVHTTFPADGASSRALYKVDDGLAATNGLHNVRLIALTAESDELFRTINLMSNERLRSTVIYDEKEVFYDIGLRLKGSEHSRTTSQRLGFNLGFNSEHLFRGIHKSVALDRSESTGFGQREMLAHQTLNHAGGVPTKYHDLVKIMAPRAEFTGAAELQLARYTDVFLNDQFENGADGMVFEYELVYQLNPPTDNGTTEGNKIPAPDSVVGTSIRNMGDDKENYRWTFLIKNNEDRDDYSRLILWAKWYQTSGTTFTSGINTYLDVNQWLRGVAANVLPGAGDSYGGDGAQHNVQFYVRPTDGRMLYFPHDMDAFYQFNRGAVPNGDVTKLINSSPAYSRMYYGHLKEMIATTYNTTYMTRWANHFGQLLPGQPFASHLAFIGQRSAFLTTAINSAIPNAAFAITSNGGNDASVTTDTYTLTGTGNLDVFTILINGVSYPITWTTTTAWSITFPLLNGVNAVTVQGVDRFGVSLGTNARDTINITTTGGSAIPIRINEWAASNAGPDGFADPADDLFQDWIELYNPNAAPVVLTGYTLTDNLSQPGKWTLPAGTSIPGHGFLLIWADNQTAQNGVGTSTDLHAPFQLNGDGESIGLFNATGIAQHTVTFGLQEENVSEGLFPDGDTTAVHTMRNWTPRTPNTLSDPLQFTTVTRPGGAITLTWNTIVGRTYRVQHRNSLADDWTQLGADIPATGPTATITDPAGAPRRFYRVIRVD